MQDGLEQLIYTSVAAPGLDVGDLFKIVETASRKNVDREITGLLVFVQGRFFQAIEGPGPKLDSLIATLKRDPRHHSLKILKRNKLAERQFPHWRMRRVSVDDQKLAWSDFQSVLERNDDAASILSEFDVLLESGKFAA